MRRLVHASLVAVLATSFAASAHAQSIARPPAAGHNPAITPVQGWWEEDHAPDRARDAYWRLPRPALERYNRLQFQINQMTAQRQQLDERIHRAVQEQREILGFARR
jgi:hypothetical protein